MLIKKKKTRDSGRIVIEGIRDDQNVGTGTVTLKDYNSKLDGQAGYKIYESMIKSDSRIKALVNSIITPILQNKYYIDGDDQVTEFLNRCFFSNIDFRGLLKDLLSGLFYTHAFIEKAYKVNNKENTIDLHAIQGINLKTVETFLYDEMNGDFIGLRIRGKKGAESVTKDIYNDKLIVFWNDADAQNPEGQSILRPLYMNWDLKSTLLKVDAVANEKYGVGVTVTYFDEGRGNKSTANTIGAKIRSNEYGYLSIPKKLQDGDIYSPTILQGNQSPIDSIRSVEYHDKEMNNSILATFMNLGQGIGKGSYALAKIQQNPFAKYLNGKTENILSPINNEIKRLTILNFGEQAEYYKIKYNDFAAVDPLDFADSFLKFFQLGVFNTNDINTIRKKLGYKEIEKIKIKTAPRAEEEEEKNTEITTEQTEKKIEERENEQKLKECEVKLDEYRPRKEYEKNLDVIGLTGVFDKIEKTSLEVLGDIRDKAILNIAGVFRGGKDFGKEPFKILKKMLKDELNKIYIKAFYEGKEQLAKEQQIKLGNIEQIEAHINKILGKYGDNVSSAYIAKIESIARDIKTSVLDFESLDPEIIEQIVLDRIKRDISQNYVLEIAGKANIWVAKGREAEAIKRNLKWGYYSAILDRRLCSGCNLFDGLKVEYTETGTIARIENNPGFEEVFEKYGVKNIIKINVPNPHCLGKEKCRCVIVWQ